MLFGKDIVDTEGEARRVAAEQGLPYISPYSDLQVRHTMQAVWNVILLCSIWGPSY